MTLKKPSYGLSNIDMEKFMTKSESHIVEETTIAISKAISLNDEPIAEIVHDKKPTKKQIKKPQKFNNDDSDSVVSDSGDECDPQEYRHIAKRRRLLPTTATETTTTPKTTTIVSKVEPNADKKLNENSVDDGRTDLNHACDDNDDGEMKGNDIDFSGDDEQGDRDYVLPKKDAIKARKKTVAARRRPTKKNIGNQEKTPDNQDDDVNGNLKDKTKTPRVTKKKANGMKTSPKAATIKKAQQQLNRTRATESKATQQLEGEELEEEPLNPEDLKYALAMDYGDITTVPRVQLNELDDVDNLAQQYINNALPTSTKIKTKSKIIDEGPPINAKATADRQKLLNKIAAGKLNENFVRINIQKKTFVRGKKSVNFSKYKKKEWKHKKHIAALSGPDMNMGGCDGGVLTCFTCGQPGHFAQNCKIKGDALLPLSAQLEADPSPFPTLEEAEQMAAQSALSVHSRNISKLPTIINAALYRDVKGLDDQNENVAKKDNVSENIENRNSEGLNSKSNTDDDDDDDDDGEYLIETDDELENMNLDEAEAYVDGASSVVTPESPEKYAGHKIPEEFLKKAGLEGSHVGSQFKGVGSMYDLNPDGTVKDVTPEVLEALRMFGHTDFRKGQDRAVMRILSGMSTLVTLSTGSGKSLCYQLPAYLYSRFKKSITLVISPLVSLMEDQVTGVPHFLRAYCMHTNQTPQQRLKIMEIIRNGEIDILLVSPEAVVAGERSSGFGSILRQLPPIAFACIDEAHCVSQWSHNFRPSYLMVCKVLKKNLGVNTVLGLTATATLPTRQSIINHLGIGDGERGIISDIPLPDNLILSASKDVNRDAALLQLLNSKRFDKCQSVIIYCTRRDECERISAYLRTCMQDRKETVEDKPIKKKRRRVNWQAEPYHAGMPASRRRTIQNAFMSNELRIVVATIAFGMGINKPDIRAIIHYNMPRNFESYVQEIGRAGRDGLPSHCHLFIDSHGNDQMELRRHIFANSIGRHCIRKLLQRIFVPCSCKKSTTNDDPQSSVRACSGHEIGFSAAKTVEALDVPEENITTLLCYMELDTRWNIQLLSSAYIMAKVISYGGPKYLKHAAKECPPLAMAIALEIKRGNFQEDSNVIEFSVIDIAAAIGWHSGVVKFQLKNLEWMQVNGYNKRAPLNVNFFDLGMRIKAPGDFTSEEIDDALDTLYNRAVQQEHTQLIQLQYVFKGLSSVSYNTYAACTGDNISHDRSDQLKAIIRDYFSNDYPRDMKLETDTPSQTDDSIENDIYALISMYPDNEFTGRNIARIFQGISSPNFPAVMWGRCKFWRVHLKFDFNRIVQLANAIIMKRLT